MNGVAVSPDGVPIHYETRGSGSPALVLVHGWACDRSYWHGQIGPFADRHQVVAVDLAGHGDSGVGRGTWTMAAFGDDVVAVVERLGLERMVLVGHSMGGDVIVEAARKLGGRVAGLVWVDVYRRLGTPRPGEEVERFLATFRDDFPATTRSFVHGMFPPGSDPGLVERIAGDMAAAPPRIALDAIRHSITNDGPILERLRELDLPVVAVNPDLHPTDVESLKRHGVDTVLMPGVGHFPMLEAPAAFNRLLAGVVARFTG